MNTSAELPNEQMRQCPICDAQLRVDSFRTGETACSGCGHVIWYQKRTVDGISIMDAISGIVAINMDIERVSNSLLSGTDKARVVLNLSRLKFISSAFVAGMIALQKRVRAANGRLILCGMHPIVRETLHGARLDTYFEICENEQDALDSL
jgi:anti-sigma B factor antagonist